MVALGSVTGCDAPVQQSQGNPVTPIVRSIENDMPDVQCTASVVYLSEPEKHFDITLVHDGSHSLLTLILEKDGEEVRPLEKRGQSDSGDRSSFRVSPPEGGWKESDNGTYDIIAIDGKKRTHLSNLRIDILGQQKDESIRVLDCGRFENLNKSFYWLLYRAQEGDKVNVGDLYKRKIVLRSESGKEFPLILEPTIYDRDEMEVRMHASTTILPSGTYDLVLKEDVATIGGGKIMAGTITTLELP